MGTTCSMAEVVKDPNLKGNHNNAHQVTDQKLVVKDPNLKGNHN